ncbi:hypothetical protein IC801_08665 [Geobacillus sp. 44B]|nr:hypothetical protein BSK33_17345 [Geobacillus sp. 44B]QNU39206.1 hypothetical protein IC801_08665 [Geobacillus sp. 44B]
MSLNGSEKEFLFTLFLKQNKQILEKELQLSIEDIALEKPFGGMKVDMYGINYNSGVEIFVENLLYKSNGSYQSKILKMIETIDKGIIIYQALDFQQKHIVELHEAVKSSSKPINLYLSRINVGILIPLEMLNRMHKLKVYENLNLLAIENPIQFLEKESIVQPIKGDKFFVRKKGFDFSKREDRNAYLLKSLREKIPYFLPFHREKANLDTIRVLSFGAGRSDCNYFVSISDRRNMAFVELRFSENNSLIYNAIKKKEDIVREKIGKDVAFRDNSIVLEFKHHGDVEETVNRLADIFEKMILAFANYIYYFDEDKRKMWEHHQEGI